MDNNISDLLEQLKQNGKHLHAIVQTMDEERRKYEESQKVLREKFNMISSESKVIGNIKVSIRLGDLLDEIAWLSLTSYDDIHVSIGTDLSLDGVYSKEEILGLIGKNDSCKMQFRLSNSNNPNADSVSFDYFAFLPFNFNSIQADGRTLFDHCSVATNKRFSGGLRTELVVDQDIEDVIITFDLNYLILENNAAWRPADLISQAVVNCEERKYNAKVNKIRERIK